MSLRSSKIVNLIVVNRQVLFVIAVLLAPILILHLMTNASLRAMQMHKEFSVNRDYPFMNLSYVQSTAEEMTTKADKMTPDQYENLRQINPQLPATLEVYRTQMKARVHQLHKMSEDELAEQLSARIPALPRADDAAVNTDALPALEQKP